jgi:UDP-2-acetamido-3-amino-2,3-dideoxy-glucuronate N-acetyltransferase
MISFQAHETAVIDEDCLIGKGTRIWHFSHVMKRAVIGENCNIGQNVVISTGVCCEDDVFLGPSCVFTNISNPRSAVSRKEKYEKTIVKRGATIGANATIVCGHTIGEYAMIGAGAVVTKDVPAYALVIGNPARQDGWVSEYGHRLSFDSQGVARCPESGEVYLFRNGAVVKTTCGNR